MTRPKTNELGERLKPRRFGRVLRCGYYYIKNWEHPLCGKQGYVAEHRLIMEEHIGRFLSPEETVHHIDGVTTNNKISNLKLYKTRGEHTRLCHPEIAIRNSILNKGKRRSIKTEFKKGQTPWNKKV